MQLVFAAVHGVAARRLGRWLALGLAMSALHSVAARAGKIDRSERVRILVVSSYHREYLWTQDTNRGLCSALLQFGYFDREAQATEYTRTDSVRTSRAVVKKVWMDTKRHPSRGEIARAVVEVMDTVQRYRPDLVLLGDDNAANYVGNLLIDTDTPAVFWGVNGLPLKYGLIDVLERPGHNVTGVYQSGYLAECVHYLRLLVPTARTFAVLSDDSETGRAKAKELQALAQAGKLELELVASVVTNSLTEWQSEALRLQSRVDAFFVLNHNTIRDERDRQFDQMEVGAWYLRNIRKPDCGQERQFAEEGMLLTVDDSGFKQAFEAMAMADAILRGERTPAETPVRAPARGPIIVNRERARMLRIDLAHAGFVEEYADSAVALRARPATAEARP